jgi:hypothetical protein
MRELCVDEMRATNGGGLCKEFLDGGTIVTTVGGFVVGLSTGASVGPMGALIGCMVGGTLGMIAPQLLKTVVCSD